MVLRALVSVMVGALMPSVVHAEETHFTLRPRFLVGAPDKEPLPASGHHGVVMQPRGRSGARFQDGASSGKQLSVADRAAQWRQTGWSQDGSPAFRVLGVGLFVAAAGDLAATEWMLSRGHDEKNPVQTNRVARLASHVAVPAFMYWATERIHRGGRRRLALLARVGFAVAYSYAVIHNVRLTPTLSK